ncbi:MAG: archease [Gemmatimonadetes bacterium]|nr:archease [Gemmatimonadota bacterium]
MAGSAELLPGVVALDHTADVGIEVRAPSLPALFHLAAAGMMALLWDRPPVGAGEDETEHTLGLKGEDLAGLLAAWLRELLFLHERDGVQYRSAEFETLEEHRLHARVRLAAPSEPPARELKGVTYHGLEVEERDGGWRAQVIFDV